MLGSRQHSILKISSNNGGVFNNTNYFQVGNVCMVQMKAAKLVPPVTIMVKTLPFLKVAITAILVIRASRTI